MQNLPNIAPAEIVVVGAALVLLCFVPAVLAWSDRRRAHRLQQQALAAAAATWAGAPMATAEAGLDQPVAGDAAETAGTTEPFPEPSGFPTPAAAVDIPVAEEPSFTELAAVTAARVSEPAPAMAEPAPEPEAAAGLTPPAPAPEPRRYQCQLQDLRQVRLRDWPPASVREDPERFRLWHQAEALAHEHRSAINTAPLASPVAVQSCCMGAADTDGLKHRLRFLLFPVLWPVAEDQAVAEAVFEIDTAGGEIRSWVEARHR